MRFLYATIRTTVILVMTIFIYGIWLFGNLFIPNKLYWRQFAYGAWAKVFVKLAGIEIEVIGEKPQTPFFLVCNHLGYIDIPVLRSKIDCVFVAKKEVSSWFLMGNIATNMGNIFINREQRRDIAIASEKILSAYKNGEGIVIFPEGKSTAGENVEQFKSSFFEVAVIGKIPINYAAISYNVEDPEISASEYVCWGQDISLLAHFWRMMRVRKIKALIVFGAEPIAGDDRKLLANELWNRVNERFIPVR